MKIRKFNENTIGPKPKGVDTEYIDMCFVDFLDVGAKTKYDKKLVKKFINNKKKKNISSSFLVLIS